jgi:hypothetical protein
MLIIFLIILLTLFVVSNTYCVVSCFSCLRLVLPDSLDCPFSIVHSVFSYANRLDSCELLHLPSLIKRNDNFIVKSSFLFSFSLHFPTFRCRANFMYVLQLRLFDRLCGCDVYEAIHNIVYPYVI